MELRINEMIIEKPPSTKPKISYEDILQKMGMFVSNGQLHLIEDLHQPPSQSQQDFESQQQFSYIHNKYFQNQPKQDIPKQRLSQQQLLAEQQRISEIKSKKLFIEPSTIRTHTPHRFSMNNIFQR
jgi:hypothetical protein